MNHRPNGTIVKHVVVAFLVWIFPATLTVAQHHRGGGGGIGFGNPFGLGLGFGYGFGFGLGGFNYHPNQVAYINQQALQNGSRATMGPVSRNVYANDQAAYYNHIHDVGSLERYPTGTRREIESRVGRFSDGPPPSLVKRERLAKAQRDGEPVHRRERSPIFAAPQSPQPAETRTPALPHPDPRESDPHESSVDSVPSLEHHDAARRSS